MAIVLFAFFSVFLLAAAHPFTTYPISLYLIRLWQRAHGTVTTSSPELLEQEESYAVCVCAYNEEALIAEKARNLIALRQVFPNLQILIYVDAATDRTAKILREYKDDIDIHVSPVRHGKTHGMNLLVSKTSASIVIFTDANVLLDVESLQALPKYFANPQVGCVCGHLKYVNEDETVTAKTGSLYWRMEEYIKKAESDTGSVMGADGSIFAIRRALHYAPPDHIIDDMFVSLRILCDGYRIVRAPEITAYEKSVTAPKEEFKRKIRIACQAFNVNRLLWPGLRNLSVLDRYKYISHKLMRWLVIYWLLFAAFFFEAGMMAIHHGTAGILLMTLAGALLYAGVYKRLPVALQLVDILSAFIATGIGVWHSLAGEHFQTWSPASSIRKG